MNSRTLRLSLLISLLIALLALAAGAMWFHRLMNAMPAAPDPVQKLVEIPPGASLNQVSRILAREGIVEPSWKIQILSRWRGDSREIKAGHYDLSSSGTVSEILEKLVSGDVSTIRVTIPEGWTAPEVVRILADSMSLDPQDLLARIRDPLARWRGPTGLPLEHGLEGYLFPETYHFVRGSGGDELLGVLLETFARALDDSTRARIRDSEMDLHGILTVASIVEAEAMKASERPIIAAVYLNRIRRGWKLEADPTVAFALNKQGEALSLRDLQVDSRYNTYRYPGLPPGPINNPGLASMKAVLWPDPDCQAMYFVADGKGGHVFSETWDGHRKAVREYRRALRDRSAQEREP